MQAYTCCTMLFGASYPGGISSSEPLIRANHNPSRSLGCSFPRVRGLGWDCRQRQRTPAELISSSNHIHITYHQHNSHWNSTNTIVYLRHKESKMAPNWDRLIRFIATDGRELRGQPILPSPDFDVGSTTEATGLKANVISVSNGDIFSADTKVTDEEVTVKKLLGPVTTDEVPIIRCIGLNFIKHSKSQPLNPIEAMF